MKPLDIVLDYINRGWRPIPVHYETKQPIPKDWTQLRISQDTAAQQFTDEKSNVGILLGDPSGGLVDIDLDCPEAIRLAQHFLPSTLCFGRKSKPRSHWLYVCQPPPETEKFADDANGMLLELRATGCQTVFPGSVHPSGERIRWEAPEEAQPYLIKADDLQNAARRLAAAALLLQDWRQGSRDDIATALCGGLLRDGWEP
ncbi:MAG: bifunctional DNA primase/polymerase, partial [Pyrinomonadaceae bacterium]